MLVRADAAGGIKYELHRSRYSYTLICGSKSHTYHAATEEAAILTYHRLIGHLVPKEAKRMAHAVKQT
jgi:hypothetical protein